jgi:hypothetical protein
MLEAWMIAFLNHFTEVLLSIGIWAAMILATIGFCDAVAYFRGVSDWEC